MKRPLTLTILALLWAVTVQALAAGALHTTPQGARYRDLQTGSGASAAAGDVAIIHFIGWLDSNGNKGREIYNSRRDGKPVAFVIGTDRVMPGWNVGVTGMQQGGRRLLMLPPELGFGSGGVDDVIPPDAPLIFLIELVGLERQHP